MVEVKPVNAHSGELCIVKSRELSSSLRQERRMLRRLGYDDCIIDHSLNAALANNTTIEKELLASGAAFSCDHFRKLANYLILPFQDEIDPDCVTDRPHIDSLLADPRRLRLDNGETERQYAIVPCARDLASLHLRLSSRPEIRRNLVVTTPEAMRAAVWKAGETRRISENINALMVWEPRFSARIVFWGKQGFLVGCGLATLVTGVMLFPDQTLLSTHILFSALYFFALLVRLASIRAQAKPEPPAQAEGERELPVYTVLVPLYREAGMIQQLTTSMARLNWPASKLDIKLICETDDHETASAIKRAALPPQFELVIVPPSGLRTKPNALNYALTGARGRYVVIYDAEDRPHPDQLREAWQTFRNAPLQLACLQAPLTIANIGHNWITGLYACEYAGLFRGILPFLARHRFPLPLGGTSNHFRIEALRHCRGWDPYNVAEDADLGLRLHRLGYYCGAITAETFEDAPTTPRAWIAQRSRWIKGWLQTSLVALREPGRLRDELGLLGFAVFIGNIGGVILSSLLHPLLFVALAMTITMHVHGEAEMGELQQILSGLDIVNILASYWVFMRLGISRMREDEKTRMRWSVLHLPLYWLMLSYAAWKAFWELHRTPYLWRKTDHQPSQSKVTFD